MSDQADSPGFEQQAPSQDSGGSAPDPIMSRLDELASSIQGLRPPEPEPEPEYGDYAFSEQGYAPDPAWDTPDFDQSESQYQQQDPQAEQDAWAQINQTIQQQVQQGVQDAVTPFMVQQKAAALEAKYPDLQKPEVAQRIVQQAEQFAHMLAQSSNLSPEQANAMARSPELIERLYLAERAQRTAGQETPANGGPGAHLEGNGAQPGTQETDFFDGLLNAGNGAAQANRFGWT